MRKRDIIIAIFVGLLAVIGIIFVLLKFSGIPAPFPALKNTAVQTENTEEATGSVLKVKKPVVVESTTVSKLLTAKDGGKLMLTDPKGTEVTFYVPPESLEKDTEFKLSALSEVPIVDYTSSLGNGVLIEPKEVKFKIPASITFNFSPTKKEEGQNTVPSEVLPQNVTGVLGIETSITPTPTIVNNNRGIIIVADKAEDSKVEPTANSQDGKQSSAPVNQTGAYVPDEITPEKAAKWMDHILRSMNAGCNSAKLDALFTAYEKAQSVDDSKFARVNIKQCLKDRLNDMEGKCKNNKMLLRRRDINILIILLESQKMQDEKLRAIKLKAECTAEYQIKGENSTSINSGVISYRIDAKVCGYLDDFWDGKERGDITVPGTPAHHWIDDIVSFVLPPSGGSFFAKAGGGTYSAVTLGGIYSFSENYALATGYYNGFDKVILYGWNQVQTPVTIQMTNPSCVETVPIPEFDSNSDYNPYKK